MTPEVRKKAVVILTVVLVQSAAAAPGDLLLTIERPADAVSFGFKVGGTQDGHIFVSDPFARVGDCEFCGAVSVYDIDGSVVDTIVRRETKGSHFGYNMVFGENEFLITGHYQPMLGVDHGDIGLGNTRWIGDAIGFYDIGDTVREYQLTDRLDRLGDVPFSDPDDDPNFGTSVWATEDTVLISNPTAQYREDDGRTGVGKVYGFDRITREIEFELKAPELRASGFGNSIEGNDDVLFVSNLGKFRYGGIEVFDHAGSHLFSILNPVEADDRFAEEMTTLGQNVVASAMWYPAIPVGAGWRDGGEGKVYLFDGRTGNTLLEIENIGNDNESLFGWKIASFQDKLIVSNFSRVFVFEGIASSCDLDGDFVCSATDVDVLVAEINGDASNTSFDVNRDSTVDLMDFDYWIRHLGKTLPGDANLDGAFTSGDLVSVFEAAQFEDGLIRNSTWETGDWTGDMEFGSEDLIVAFQTSLFEGGNLHTVPEPVTSVWSFAVILIYCAARSRPS